MSRSRFTKAAGIATIGLMLSLAPTGSAQTDTGTGGRTAGSDTGASRVDNHRGFDWGWLGLLGLLGLAGMRRPHGHEGRDRHMGTAHA